jgi:phosphoribosyl 1,2-cyclic phosphate phosphodiesterase
LAYCTDCSAVPEASLPLLAGLDTLVLGMLRHHPHPAHLSVEEALATAARIAARRTFFVHMCHDLPHEATNATLAADKQLAYDGLVIEI